MSKWMTLGFLLALLVVFTISPALLSAQDNSGGKQITVTGCIKSGQGGEGHYMIGQDGNMYELWGKGIAAHVGHTVTVTGTQTKLSPAQEQKKEASEKAEAGSASYMDLKVANLKMVSESCQ